MLSLGMHIWVYIFCIIEHRVRVQAQDMIWLGGNKMADQLSVQGAPGGRSGMGVWQESNDIVWMFGGIGMSTMASGTGGPVMLNDMWCFTNQNHSWHQVHPGTVSNLTVSASRSPQIPRPRKLPSVCGVGHVMVLFGGFAENNMALGDLWVFDTKKKVWRMLVNSYNRDAWNWNQTAQGTRDIGPEARGDSAYWCTNSHLYIFGGQNGSSHIFSDMWRLSLIDFIWEELKSSKEAPAALKDRLTADYPGGRNGAMTWLSSTGVSVMLFMFGGNMLSKFSRDRHITTGYSSDMWQYKISTDSWHFMTGSTQPGQPGEYGHISEMSLSNVPGCRRGGATWTDDNNNMLWLFGGEGADSETPSDIRSAKLLSDLWRYHPQVNQWEWVGGSQKGDVAVSRTKKGIPTHRAFARGRIDAATWKKSDSQTFFLFGGLGHDEMQLDGYLSDLWLMDISSTVSYHFYVPAVYGFAVIFGGLALLLCLAVLALCARHVSKSPQWNLRRTSTRYSQLNDSDT